MVDQQNAGAKGVQSLREILSQGLGRPVGRSPNSQTPWKETKIEECTCTECGDSFEGEVTTFLFVNPPRSYPARQCPGCIAAREAQERREAEQQVQLKRVALQEAWRRECGIPRGLHASRFADLDPDYQKALQRVCQGWAESFALESPGESPSLMLYSSGPGVGKTTLMACIANHVIDTWKGAPRQAKCPVTFVSGPGLVRRVRATYNIPDGDVTHEREEDVYRALQGVRLLMLDDVGKEQPRTYRAVREMYWHIVDERVKAGLPVVLNSRLPLTGPDSLEDLMGVDTVNRLYGMCRGEIYEIEGISYRTLKRIA